MAALSVKKPLAYVIIISVYLLGISLTIACLVTAVKKRQAFVDDKLIFGNETIEILYMFMIIATLISIIISMCCSLASNEPNIFGDGGTTLVQLIISLAWIIIPAVYTALTNGELDILISCPASLDETLLFACRISRNNFILMWINSVIMFLSAFTLCFCFYGLEIQDEEIIIDQEDQCLSTVSANVNSHEVTTPPVLDRLKPFFCKESKSTR